jgi:hypothetical protein
MVPTFFRKYLYGSYGNYGIIMVKKMSDLFVDNKGEGQPPEECLSFLGEVESPWEKMNNDPFRDYLP